MNKVWKESHKGTEHVGNWSQRAHRAMELNHRMRNLTEKLQKAVAEYFFFQAEDGIRDTSVTGVQTCALPIFAGVVTGGAEGEEVLAARLVVAADGRRSVVARKLGLLRGHRTLRKFAVRGYWSGVDRKSVV